MRALVVSSVYPNACQPTFGVFVRERIRHLTCDCQVTVIAPVPWFPLNRWLRGSARAEVPAVEVQDGITVHHPRFLSPPRYGKSLDASLYFASILGLVKRLHATEPYDVIDAHFAYPDGVAAVLLGKVLDLPTVVTLRGDEARLADHPLRRVQIASLLRRARLIAVSDSLRQTAAWLGLPPDRVRVIPNGIDGSRFQPRDRDAARERLGLPSDRRLLLSVGALIERKGHHRVVELLPPLVKAHPDLLLLVVGGDVPGTGDTYRGVIEDLVRRNGLENHVRIVPAQPHDRLPDWLSAADLFCLATRWEGWCNALTEALACGLPVVTTDVGGNAELVRHGTDGLVVPYWQPEAFAAAILRALETPWNRGAITAYATGRTWETVATEVLAELQAAVTDRGRVVQSSRRQPAGLDRFA